MPAITPGTATAVTEKTTFTYTVPSGAGGQILLIHARRCRVKVIRVIDDGLTNPWRDDELTIGYGGEVQNFTGLTPEDSDWEFECDPHEGDGDAPYFILEVI